MTRIPRLALAATCLLLGLLLAWPALAGDTLPQLIAPSSEAKAALALGSGLPSTIGVTVDVDLLRGDAARLGAQMPDGQLVLARKELRQRSQDDFTWYGSVEGAPLSSAVLTVKNGVLFGGLKTLDGAYEIEPDGAGGYIAHKADPDLSAPDDGGALIPPQPSDDELRKDGFDKTEDGSQIDLLILYTQAFATKYGTGMEAKIQNLVDTGNLGLSNSGTQTQINVVATELTTNTAFTESVGIYSVLNSLTIDATVASMRTSYKADLVSLLRAYQGTGESCGLAWMMQSYNVGNQSFSNYGYTVVEVKSASEGAGYYCRDTTLIHEIGHNLGCNHDRDNASDSGAYPYAYGYDVSGTFATIMSYKSPGITYFSTPLITYSGYAIGKDTSDPLAAYNALVISNTRSTVANFQQTASTGTGDNTAYMSHLTGSSAGWTDTLVADNDSDSDASYTVTLYAAGSQVYSGTFTVEARDQSSINLKSYASTAECGTIAYDEDTLKFRLSYQATAGGVAEFLLPTAKTAAMGLYFSGYSSSVAWKGLALANWGTSTASVTLYALGGGVQLGKTTVSVDPNERIYGTVQTYFPAILPSGIEKVVAATSSATLTGIVISSSSSNDKLLFVPGANTSYTE